MLSAVSHMHALGVIHRDLKPENFLLVHPEDHPESAKVTDFGLSLFVKPEEFLSELIGSAYYVAPEVLRSHYYSKADIWSIGVILYILLSGAAVLRRQRRRHLPVHPAGRAGPRVGAVARDLRRGEGVRAADAGVQPAAAGDHPAGAGAPGMAKGGASARPLNNALVARISKFSNMNKFKRLACKTIAASLTPDEILGLKKMFE